MNLGRHSIVLLLLFFVTSIFASTTFGQALHNTYGSFWAVGPGVTTDLILEGTREGMSAATPVTVTLYSPQGTPLAVSTVNVPSQGVSRLSVSSLLPQAGTAAQGGLSLTWTGATTAIRGKVQMNDDRGITASYLLHGGFWADTQQALFAPWYFPDDGCSGQLFLFNSSSSAIQVLASLVLNGAELKSQTVLIQPKASQSVDLKSLLAQSSAAGATIGSVVLHYAGPAHSLQPSLLLSDPASGFALMPEFSPLLAAESTGQTSWLFPDVLVATASTASSASRPNSYAIISNASSQIVTVQLSAYSLHGAKTVQGNLPPANLGPYQTQLVPLNEISRILSNTTARVGLTVTHSGSAGKLSISVFSVDSGGRTIAVPSGLVVPATGSKVAFWNSRMRPRQAVRYAVTTSDGTAPFVTLYYQAAVGLGQYTFARQQVSDEASRVEFELPSLRSSRDQDGNSFPEGAFSGLLVLSAAPQTAQQLAANQPTCAADCAVNDGGASAGTTASEQATVVSQAAFVSPAQSAYPDCPCHADLYYRPVYVGLVPTGKNHNFWQLEDSDGYNWVADGGPSGTCPLTCGYLKAWLTSGCCIGHYDEDNTLTATYFWEGGTFYQVDEMIYWTYIFPDDVIPYLIVTQNSNSFAHQAALHVGLSPPTPPSSPGW